MKTKQSNDSVVSAENETSHGDYARLQAATITVHELKTINPFFDDVFYNRKNFEVRKNDRDYKVGDRLKLVEHDPSVKRPRYVLKDIQYILPGGQYGIDPDYVVLGLKEIHGLALPLSECFIRSMQDIKQSVERMAKVTTSGPSFGRGCL